MAEEYSNTRKPFNLGQIVGVGGMLLSLGIPISVHGYYENYPVTPSTNVARVQQIHQEIKDSENRITLEDFGSDAIIAEHQERYDTLIAERLELAQGHSFASYVLEEYRYDREKSMEKKLRISSLAGGILGIFLSLGTGVVINNRRKRLPNHGICQ